MIEDKLKNLDMDNIEERSDIVSRVGDVRHRLLSQKSMLDSRSITAKSPTRPRQTEGTNETPQPQIIEEDVELEQ